MDSSAERFEVDTTLSAENFFPVVEIKDGLGPMLRWERDCGKPETIAVLVQRTANGERLKKICRSCGWPHSVVAQWVAENEAVDKALAAARRIYAEDMAMETPEIADNTDAGEPGAIPKAKHRTEVRFKLAAMLDRQRFGEQVQHNVTIDPFTEMLRRVSERRLAEMKAAQLPKDITPISVTEELEEI